MSRPLEIKRSRKRGMQGVKRFVTKPADLLLGRCINASSCIGLLPPDIIYEAYANILLSDLFVFYYFACLLHMYVAVDSPCSIRCQTRHYGRPHMYIDIRGSYGRMAQSPEEQKKIVSYLYIIYMTVCIIFSPYKVE
jgi:hypothetical protein